MEIRPNCWICGAEADSREHLAKASDLRQTFGAVSLSAPLYFRDGVGRSQRLGSVKSGRIKSEKVLCQRCNDTRTQPYDEDWATLSSALARRSTRVTGQNRIKLRQLFPGRARIAARNIHLYFVKLFGCRIVGEKVPINVEPFARAIQTESLCDGLSLIFCRDATNNAKRHIFLSAIQAKQVGSTIECAGWTYAVGRFFVEVMWFRHLRQFQGAKGHWRPDQNGTVIKLVARE